MSDGDLSGERVSPPTDPSEMTPAECVEFYARNPMFEQEIDAGEFEGAVLDAGLKPKCHTETHWSISGGSSRVNYYPQTGTVFVNGMQSDRRSMPYRTWSIDDLIRIALTDRPSISGYYWP